MNKVSSYETRDGSDSHTVLVKMYVPWWGFLTLP